MFSTPPNFYPINMQGSIYLDNLGAKWKSVDSLYTRPCELRLNITVFYNVGNFHILHFSPMLSN